MEDTVWANKKKPSVKTIGRKIVFGRVNKKKSGGKKGQVELFKVDLGAHHLTDLKRAVDGLVAMAQYYPKPTFDEYAAQIRSGRKGRSRSGTAAAVAAAAAIATDNNDAVTD